MLTFQLAPYEAAEHQIPDAALDRAREADWDGFIESRLGAIVEQERRFINEITKRYPSFIDVGTLNTLIDSIRAKPGDGGTSGG